jgi:hypothetical protein
MITVVEAKHERIIVPSPGRCLGRSLVEYGEFSEGEVGLFDAIVQPGMIVADIGANFGAHTLVFAKRAAQTCAVEPQRMVMNALRGTLALNSLYDVTPLQIAVGDVDGELGCADLDIHAGNPVDVVPGVGSLNMLCAPHGLPVGWLAPVTTGLFPGMEYAQ